VGIDSHATWDSIESERPSRDEDDLGFVDVETQRTIPRIIEMDAQEETRDFENSIPAIRSQGTVEMPTEVEHTASGTRQSSCLIRSVCPICLEEYNPGDILAVSQHCIHEYVSVVRPRG
jgi:hypothetical protein